MKKNINVTDKAIRFLAAILLAILIVSNTVGGTAAVVIGITAFLLFTTALVNFCPLYFALGISTNKRKAQQS